MTRLISFSVCVVFIFSVTFVFGQDKNYAYLNHLIKNRNYLDAAVETVRLSISNKDIPSAEFDYIEYSLRYKNADYRYVIKNCTNASKLRDTLLLSQSYFHLHNYDNANAILNGSPDKNSQPLLLVKSYQALMLFDYNNAADTAKLLKEQNSKYNLLHQQILKYHELSSRSPLFSAFISSLIPGAGQLYSGRYFDALLSFSLTAGGAAGTYCLYRNHQRSWSYMTAFFTAIFYAGNIIGAYHSAEKYNFENNNAFSQSIINKNYFYEPLDFADRRVVQ